MEYANKQAHDKVVRARTVLIITQPFFGCLALQLELVECDDNSPHQFKTMAVDGTHMFYFPEFVMKLTEQELIGVVAHEVMHCALLHMVRRQHRNPVIWNCVAAGSKISLADGTHKAIEHVMAGESLKTPVGEAKVYVVIEGSKKVLELSLANGYKLTCTPEHEILTDAGFVKAGSIKEGTTCVVDTSFAQALKGTGCNKDAARNSGRTKFDLPTGRGGDRFLRIKPQEEIYRPQGGRSRRQNDTNRAGLSSRHNRWRRNDNCCSQEAQQWADVHSTVYKCLKYQPAFSSLAGTTELPRENRATEAFWPLFVDVFSNWLSGSSVIDIDTSLLGDKTAARSAIARINQAAKAITAALHRDAKDAENLWADQGLKYSRVTAVTRKDEKALVYDLVTDKGCFTADGVIVHNCAGDYVINDTITKAGLTLPGKPCHQAPKQRDPNDKTFYYLLDPKYDNMSTEEIYERIKEDVQNQIKKQQQGKGGKKGQGDDGGEGGMVIPDTDLDIDQGGCGGVTDAAAPNDKGKQDTVGREWDANIRMAVNVAKRAAAGSTPGYLERLVKHLDEPRVSWREITRQFIDTSMSKDYSWTRPNRRYVDQGLHLPGFVPDALHHMIFVADTSGSITEPMLKAMMSEVGGALGDGVADKLTVLYADTEVRHVDEFVPGDIVHCQIHGGGGTCFNDSFRWIKENAPDAACIVYLTDMLTSSFGEDLGIPTLWACYLPRSMLNQVKPPFGSVIPVDTSE